MRMRFAAVAVAALLSVVAGPASAQTIDAAQVTNDTGATVLLPYFEAQVPKKIGGKAPGVTTLFSINNASATAILAHVTIWTDLAVPVFAFNVYLTGFDVQTIDVVDLLNGKLPQTASVGQDPTDTSQSLTDGISPKGPISQDINFASCNGILPPPAQLSPDTVEHLRAALTGKPSALFSGQCAGRDFGEKKPIARGFVTADTVNNCTSRLPSDPVYFSQDITFQNVLWGDAFILNKSKKLGRGDALVAIRADSNDASVDASNGRYTFYQRIVDDAALSQGDDRQPLSSTFAGRFVNVPKHPLFPTGTSALVWRDPKVNQQPFTCGTSPEWFPLDQEQIVVFDEQENPEISTAAPFPASTQVVKVGGPSFPVTPQAGWLYLNLNDFVGAAPFTPQEDLVGSQAFVSMIFDSKGKYSVGVRAAVLDDADDADHTQLPLP
jgi:hypothetical protein